MTVDQVVSPQALLAAAFGACVVAVAVTLVVAEVDHRRRQARRKGRR